MPVLPPEPPESGSALGLAADLVAALAAGGDLAAVTTDQAGEFLEAGMPTDPEGERIYSEVVDILRSHLRAVERPDPAVVRALVRSGPALSLAALRGLLPRAIASGWDACAAEVLRSLAAFGDEDTPHELIVRAARSESEPLREAAVAWLSRPVSA